MNHKLKLLTLALATGTSGLVTFGLSNTEFAARLPLDTILAALTSLGLLRFAFTDYSHRVQPLPLPAVIMHPTPRRVVRVSAHIERLAA